MTGGSGNPSVAKMRILIITLGLLLSGCIESYTSARAPNTQLDQVDALYLHQAHMDELAAQMQMQPPISSKR